MKKNSGPNDASSVLNDRRRRAIPVAVLLIFVVLLSMGSGIYASASYFAQQVNVTVTTTIHTTTTSWTTLTVWSAVTQTVQGVLTTMQYTTSTSTVTVTAGTSTPVVVTVGGTKTYSDFTKSVRAVAITLPAGASIVSIGINWASRTTGNVQLALYSNAGSKPRNLLTQTGSTPMGGSVGWQDIPVSSSYTTSASGTYWVAFQVSSARYIYISSGSNLYCAQSYSAFPNFWCSSTGTGAWTFNMRVTYRIG